MKLDLNPHGGTITFNDRPILDLAFPALADHDPDLAVEPLDESGWHRVRLTWTVEELIAHDDLAIEFDYLFEPDFWFTNHLAPFEDYVIAQHVFRSPVILAARDSLVTAIVPELEICPSDRNNPWYLDLDAPSRKSRLGMSWTHIPQHVLFKKREGMLFTPGEISLGFYVAVYQDDAPIPNPFAKTADFFWNRYGHPLLQKGQPTNVPLETYVDHTYRWAFDSWKDSVWQQFELNGRKVGAPQFIVNISQSPNYDGPWYQREFMSIWNQAWFSSLRSAAGLMRYAQRTGRQDLQQKARMTLELALAAPQRDGLFPSVIGTANEKIEVNGQGVDRPRPWSEATWFNSDRCPRNYGITREWYHILDASWTALLMLRWHDEIEADPRLLDYASAYADKLLTLQDEAGFFPGWVHPETHAPGPVLNQSPETSMSVTFLLKLSQITGDDKYRRSALKAIDAVLGEIVPTGRWEDYETYWSCAPWWNDNVGKKIERNDMYKQNTLSIFWTAEALLAAYRATGETRYLHWGKRTLDELSMHQQVWQPPFIYVPALGGFAVMNADGEWNDSRQTLFAEIYLDYYRETGDAELFERGIAALQSGFIMMYCPENPITFKMWERVHPFFGPEDYGFMMENYAHGGETSPQGMGMGPFTIYDWGNGAASEAANRIHDHWGDVYIDRARGQAFAINAVRVETIAEGWQLTNQAGKPRELLIVDDQGTRLTKPIDTTLIIN